MVNSQSRLQYTCLSRVWCLWYTLVRLLSYLSRPMLQRKNPFTPFFIVDRQAVQRKRWINMYSLGGIYQEQSARCALCCNVAKTESAKSILAPRCLQPRSTLVLGAAGLLQALCHPSALLLSMGGFAQCNLPFRRIRLVVAASDILDYSM